MTEFSPPRRRTQNTSTRGSLVYHTQDCQAFVRITNWTEVSPTEQAAMEECQYCSGSHQLNDGGTTAYYRAALAHDPEEAGD